MPRVIIDQRPIEVPDGTKVITAAEQLGIVIPRFCYHPALGAVGACRVCAVKFIEGPIKGIQMSCMIDAHDGMVVATDDPEAMDFRRHVIEWLMIGHPHDCPVCDEGGHCLLQDMTVAGGHGRRRYPGPKRTHVDQYLGPLVQHEMNRCIQCYRCSRFYQEYTGYRDLGVMSIASRVYFGRYQEGTLESPFSGNLADICPTGVYTDKPSRYVGRRWDYDRSPGICISCSLGCNTVVSARYRQVVRQEARYSARINGHFICDRGRHAYVYADSEDRPRQARIDQRSVTMDAALQTAAERLAAQTLRHGPDCVTLWGSSRASLETMAAMLRLSRERDWPLPLFFDDVLLSAAVRQTAAQGSRLPAEIETADFILVLGADPLNEAPMLALAIRQAVRKGAAAVCLDPAR
jgi:NADH-quinone oxidoreductase subunit G